ncbi:MAG: tRNA-dihydrouridine synthase family protein [Lachnospiraceae bacterium]|nr:tRNA-dihydrouridine synthase family protein [Lachnospiraceae bacterium]
MMISFAPMEGVTTATFRRVYKEHFTGVDRYYTPFLAATQTGCFKKRETREYTPFDPLLVPQVMAAKAEHVIWAARLLADAGYEEVNLNLGCPAATVVTKKKGSGMLADPDLLDRFLDGIFREQDLPKLSVKTRIGFADPGEAERLGEIYGKYPISEVIIHPRVREDFYNRPLSLQGFEAMKKHLPCPVAFNGDIRTVEDAGKILTAYPDTEHLMIGRGLLADPLLAEKIKAGEGQKAEEERKAEGAAEDKNRIRDFVTDLWDAYSEILSGERDVLFKMKEIWFHLGSSFPDCEKQLDKLKKCRTAADYRGITETMFRQSQGGVLYSCHV